MRWRPEKKKVQENGLIDTNKFASLGGVIGNSLGMHYDFFLLWLSGRMT